MKKILLLIAFSLIVVASSVSATNFGNIVSPDTAKESVIEFMNNTVLHLNCDNEISLPSGEFYIIHTNSDEFWINKNSGIVERATFYSAMSEKNGDIIPIEKALEIASSYARQHNRDFENRNFELDYQKLHNTGVHEEYTFIWNEYQQDIETTSFTLVTVNANSGEIVEYVGLNRDVYISLDPKISNTAAIKIASNYFSISPSHVKSVKLRVVNLNLIEQRLIWEVHIEQEVKIDPTNELSEWILQGGIVQIDADSGKTLQIFNLL